MCCPLLIVVENCVDVYVIRNSLVGTYNGMVNGRGLGHCGSWAIMAFGQCVSSGASWLLYIKRRLCSLLNTLLLHPTDPIIHHLIHTEREMPKPRCCSWWWWWVCVVVWVGVVVINQATTTLAQRQSDNYGQLHAISSSLVQMTSILQVLQPSS